MNSGIHAIGVSLTTGTLVLAILALSLRFWIQPNRQDSIGSMIWKVSDNLALYSALFGTIILLFAIISGLMLRPMDAFLYSPISKNKILTASLSFLCWLSFIRIRLKVGARLWDQKGFIAHYAFVMALLGLIFLVTTNSIGGELSGIPSGYEQIAAFLGFRTRRTFYLADWINIFSWIIGMASLGVGFFQLFRKFKS